MPGATSPIFNRKATEKLKNPDDLDKYIRVTNPSVWVILGACVSLVVALLIWGVFGAVTTSVSTTGILVDGKVMCFLGAEDVAKVNKGDFASVDGEGLRVAEVATVPLSRDEEKSVLKSDYLVSTLAQGDWSYQVIFEGDTSELVPEVPLTVNITVERVAPISLLLGGDK